MSNTKKIPVPKFNKPQEAFVLFLPYLRNGATWIGGRGVGKTFIIAWLVHMQVKHMAGASFFILGSTFKQLLTTTLPPLFDFLEKLGYVRGEDYVIGQRPPANWGELPRQAPVSDFSHYITFYNPERCVGYYLVSQDKGATEPRGLSLDGGFRDEALLIDQEQYVKGLRKTNRGNNELFKHVPIHHAVFDFSSMPYTNETKYLTDRGKYYSEEFNLPFDELREKQIDLQLNFLQEKSITERIILWDQLQEVTDKLIYKPSSDGHLYMESSVFDNIRNVGLKYIEDEFKDSPQLIFTIEMLSKKAGRPEGGYYPSFNRKLHTYSGEYRYDYIDTLEYDFQKISKAGTKMISDYNTTLPIHIGVDWGAAINFLVAAQHHKSINRLNVMKDFYVKNDTYKPMIEAFCKYYQEHEERVIYFHYDPQGNKLQPNSRLTFAEESAAIMKANGWTVILCSLGAAYTSHARKYDVMDDVFKERKNYVRVRINSIEAKKTMLSVENARLKIGDTFQKDKSDEKKTYLDQSETTHPSDAFDNIVLNMIRNNYFGQNKLMDVSFR